MYDITGSGSPQMKQGSSVARPMMIRFARVVYLENAAIASSETAERRLTAVRRQVRVRPNARALLVEPGVRGTHIV